MSRVSDKLSDFIFCDTSYPSPEQQLIWRIEDLTQRPEVFSFSDSTPMCDADLRYALPECFYNPRDIERAIALAEEKLAADYGKSPCRAEEYAAEVPKSDLPSAA